MSEHVHEWAFSSNVYTSESSWTVAVVKCKTCGLERGPEWMELRLNAAERLRAEDARILSFGSDGGGEWAHPRNDRVLDAQERAAAYAGALEEQDD